MDRMQAIATLVVATAAGFADQALVPLDWPSDGRWADGPPAWGYLSDRPEATRYHIDGRGYGMAWGSYDTAEFPGTGRGDAWQWYAFVPHVAVYWDADGCHEVSTEPFLIDGYHYVAARVEAYRPELGAFECQGYNVEFYEWQADHPHEPAPDEFDGKRYATLVVPTTLPWADFNADGVVDSRDVIAFLNAYSEQRSEP